MKDEIENEFENEKIDDNKSEEVVEETTESTTKKNKKSKKDKTNRVNKTSKKGVIIAAIIGLLLGIIFVFAFSSYKIFLSPKKATFLSYLTKDLNQISTFTKELTNNNIVDFFNNGNNKITNFAINSNSNEILGSALINKDFFGLKLNNVNENYLILENNKLDALWENLGMVEPNLPSKIDFSKNPLKFSNGDKRKIYNFFAKTSTKIINNMESESFIANPTATIEINNSTNTYKTLEVQFTQSDLFMLQKEALVALKKEGVVDLLIKKLKVLDNVEVISKKELNAQIDKYIAYLDYANAYYELNQEESDYYIIYRMYCDEEGKIIAREISESYMYEGTEYEEVIYRLVTDESGYYEVKMFSQEEYSNAYYNIISDTVTQNGNKQNHLIKQSIEGFYMQYAEDGEDYEYVPINESISYNLEIETAENSVSKISLTDEMNLYKLNLQCGDSFTFEYITDEISLKMDVTDNNTTKNELLNNGAILINDMDQQALILEFGKIEAKFSEVFTVQGKTEAIEEIVE